MRTGGVKCALTAGLELASQSGWPITGRRSVKHVAFARPVPVRHAETAEPSTMEDQWLSASGAHSYDVSNDQQVISGADFAINGAVDPAECAIDLRRALGRKTPVDPAKFVVLLLG